MKSKTAKTLIILLLVFCELAAIWLARRYDQPVVQAATISDAQNGARPYLFDFKEGSPNIKEYTVIADLKFNQYSPKLFNIRVDDCLTSFQIDGQEIIDQLSAKGRFCGPDKLLRLNAAKHFKLNTLQRVTWVFSDFVGGYGIEMKHSSRDHLYLLIVFLCSLPLFVVFVYFIRKISPNRYILALLIFAALLRIMYFWHTPIGARSHDYPAHIEYVDYIIENHKLPPATLFEGHQPPLYYSSLAVLGSIGRALDLSKTQIEITYMYLGLIASLAALGVSLLIFRRLFIQHNSTIFFATLVPALSPSLIFASTRVGNDGFLYLFASLAIYYLLRFNEQLTWKNTLLAAIAISLALLTKKNAMALLPLLLLPFINHKFNFSFLKNYLLKTTVLLLIVFIGSCWFYFRSYLEFEQTLAYVPGPGEALLVGKGMENFLTFRFSAVLDKPFANTFDDSFGRQYLWEYVFKTSLFGEFWFPPERFLILQRSLMGTGLIVLLATILGICFRPANDFSPSTHTKMTILLISLLTSLVAFRALHPYGCNQDFRYVLPLLIPLGYFFVNGLSVIKTVRALSPIIRTLIFVSIGLFFVLVPAFMVLLAKTESF